MKHEERTYPMMVKKSYASTASTQAPQESGVPRWLMHFIQSEIPERHIRHTRLPEPGTPEEVEPVWRKEASLSGSLAHVAIDLVPLNSRRYVNKSLEAVNEALTQGDYFVACAETAEQRHEQLLSNKSGLFASLFFFFDYLLMRVFPKVPVVKQLYFGVTRGRYRVMSEMEIYGRIYSCGFRLVKARARQGQTYFLLEKRGEPAFNNKASYGPLITLERCGKYGRPLHVYKLRTMAPFSEYIQEYVYERYGLEQGGKIKNDPRISRVGRLLRRYWIDEFPMLINLIKGDLKLVGVRPLSRHYFSLYDEEYQQYRQRFKPGLIPPCYVDLPQTLDEIMASEERYLRAYEQRPFQTDLEYLLRFLQNILLRKVRSN